MQAQIDTLQLEMKRKDSSLEVTRAEHDKCKQRLEVEEGTLSTPVVTLLTIVRNNCLSAAGKF